MILPGAAPSIITGLAIGMGTSWFCLVTAEMISGQYGIGRPMVWNRGVGPGGHDGFERPTVGAVV